MSTAGNWALGPQSRQKLDQHRSRHADLSPLEIRHDGRDGVANLDDAVKRVFLPEAQWDHLLSRASATEVFRTAINQPPQFWISSPNAKSTAYRLFGALARMEPASALDRAIQTFGREEINNYAGRLCLKWAVLGIFENDRSSRPEDFFAKCSEDVWPLLVKATVMGSDTGTISSDLQRLKGVVDGGSNKAKTFSVDELSRSMVEAWIDRDPLVVLSWLKSRDGKPYRILLPAVIAAYSLGDPAVMSKLLTSPEFSLKASDLASACYQGNWDLEAIGSLLTSIPASDQSAFLIAYERELGRGSPRVLVDFVSAADLRLLVPELAEILSLGILQHAPHLFDKLTSNFAPEARNALLDDVCARLSPWTREASEYYLRTRGLASPVAAKNALNKLAYSDLNKAITYVGTAPKEKQVELMRLAYRAHGDYIIHEDQPVDTLITFLDSVPVELTPSVARDLTRDLTFENPYKALQFLESYRFADDAMWAVFFEKAALSGDELNDLLGKRLRVGVDPSAYSAAVSRITEQFAKQDIDSTREAVEAVPNPVAQSVCTGALLTVWGEADPLSAMDYVRQLPSGSRKDQAIAALLPKLRFAPAKCQELLALTSSDSSS